MKAYLRIEKIWCDDTVTELKVEACNGQSLVVVRAYISNAQITINYQQLHVFKKQVYGGLYDLKLGEFGPEFANGAFLARFHFHERGKIKVSIKTESEFYPFGSTQVADKATLHLTTEPSLLDNFIKSLNSLNGEVGNFALLECIKDS